jgi:uncharacterized protein (DUF697 family)
MSSYGSKPAWWKPLNWWRSVADWAGGSFSWAPDEILTAATAEGTRQQARQTASAEAPVIWLLGKVQSGKSSIVRSLTGASEAEIGEGARPMTRTARVFDFPAEAPLLRFLDTRGLGERGYDPAEDLAACETRAHLLIVVVRAADPAQDAVLGALRAVRERHPDWPIVVAQTWLHALYPRPLSHPQPYPFTGDARDADRQGVPADLSRALLHQRRSFEALPGDGALLFVPIDFTRPEDGLPPADYGLDALIDAIEVAAPLAVQRRLVALRSAGASEMADRDHRVVVGYAFAAAAADAVPAVGMVAVPIIQGAMLKTLAGRFDLKWERGDLMVLLGSLGTPTLLRYGLGFGLRQLVKLIPVYGQTAGSAAAAAASFVVTYALGYAARVYLQARRDDERPDELAIGAAYKKGLREAFDLFGRRDRAAT